MAKPLAILGGAPRFPEPLHVGRPNVGNLERFNERMNAMFERNWLSNHGPLVQELEAEICRRLEVKHAIAVCNATVGLEVLAHALDLKGEVILPAYTFVATAHAMRWIGLEPVFADVQAEDHNLDPADVERKITSKTSAILAVHLWGQGCDMDLLQAVADRHNLRLIGDAAHAFACTHAGKWIGNFGDAEVFSFHATKFLNAFEGGAVTTNDDDLARKIRLATNFGFAGYDRVESLGTNAKMPEPNGAMALTNLESLDEFVAVGRSHHDAYLKGLNGLPGVRTLTYEGTDISNWQYVVLEIDEGISGLTRNSLHKALQAEGVLARRYFYPGVHRMEPYATMDRHQDLNLPVTDRLCRQVLLLPNGTSMSPEDVQGVIEIIRESLTHAAELEAIQ